MVEGRSNRKYSDEDAVAKAAKEHGYTDIYKQSLINITEMQKFMGKKDFEEIIGGLLIKPQGKPTLVPVTDKHQPVNVADVKMISKWRIKNYGKRKQNKGSNR